MGSFLIEGGRRLSGTVTTNASKNAAVVLLNAALLNRGTTILQNVPRIEEVNRIIEVLQSIGVGIRWRGASALVISPPHQLQPDAIDYRAAIQTRSILFLLPVLAHFHQSFRVPQPGGCRLGKRTVKPHLFALENFGISIKTLRKHYQVSAKTLRPGKNVVLYESGDTVTENAIMAAALIPGTTIIKFASANYQVVDLCYFLKKLGVRIAGIGSTTLRIEGQRSIKKNVSYSISEDPIESMLFLAIAAATGSRLTIRRCPIDFLELELLKLEKMGFHYQILRRYTARNGESALVDIKTKPSKLVALEEKIYAPPFPGINID